MTSETASALLLQGPGQLAWITTPLPAVNADEIQVETKAGAISSGTELPQFCGRSRNVAAPQYPKMTGYESVGIVTATGATVAGLSVGTRVVATYGHRTRAVISATKAIAIPDEIRNPAALLLILSGDVATGIAKLGSQPPPSVLITGAGTIGLLAIFVLAARGTPMIDVVEPDPQRRALALAFGARLAVAPANAVRLENTYAAGVECSSLDAAFRLLQQRLQPHARLCVLSDGNREPLTLTPHFHERQLTVIGSSDCPDYHVHARWYFPLAARHQNTLEQLFDLQIAASELPQTFADLAAGNLAAVKVLIHY